MKRKIWYIVPILLLLAGLLGPALFTNKNHETQPANSTNVSTTGKISSQSKPLEPKESSSNSVQSNSTKETTVAKKKPSIGFTVSVAVVGKNGTILFGPGSVILPRKSEWGNTVMGALAATGLPYSMDATWSGFVESIAGEENRGMSGWMYTLNGKVGSVSATEQSISEGDEILWWYSESMSSPPPSWGDL